MKSISKVWHREHKPAARRQTAANSLQPSVASYSSCVCQLQQLAVALPTVAAATI